jgi:hypothetical protein
MPLDEAVAFALRILKDPNATQWQRRKAADDSEPQPMPLDEAVAFALRILKDPNATQWQRRKAADELQYSHDTQDDTP